MDADNRSSDRNLNIQGDVDKSIIILGDGNTVQCVNVLSTINLPPSNPVVSHSMSKDEYRWRQLLINKVRHYWIEGVLEKSLHNQSLIELGLSECNTAITSLLNGVEEFSDEAQMFPEGTQAADIFDSLGTGRTLLVLGDPGAGKTTMLLKLAQGLLDRIDDDLSQPIPVILNLSSWAKKRQPIADWLVQSIYETFQIRRSVGKAWLSQEQLVLCLDGLDEVKAEHRNDCVNALNQFIQRHGRTEIVVCSRLKDYESISEKLRLQSAIYVQPLTSKQVDLYLEQVGETLRALRSVLNHSAALKAFASSPLILSMMSLAYQGCSVDDIKQNGTLEEYR
ncbi:MAG: NACHT domain-containing protein, partial [Bacteroidota bacterium]